MNDGEVITLQVDTKEWKVIWSVGQQQLGEASIPQQMRNKALYVVVLMGDRYDVVELCVVCAT